MTDEYRPRHYRIYSHVTRNRILHVEDALQIDKVHLDAYEFKKGAGAQARAEAYVDVHEARLLFNQLSTGAIPNGSKFEAIGGGFRDGEAVGRTLVVQEVEANNPIKFTLANGPSIPMKGGLFKPAWWGNEDVDPWAEVGVLLDRRTARKIALAVLEHLQAWASVTYWQRITEGTWQPDGQGESAEEIDPLDLYLPRDVDPETGEINESNQDDKQSAPKHVADPIATLMREVNTELTRRNARQYDGVRHMLNTLRKPAYFGEDFRWPTVPAGADGWLRTDFEELKQALIADMIRD